MDKFKNIEVIGAYEYRNGKKRPLTVRVEDAPDDTPETFNAAWNRFIEIAWYKPVIYPLLDGLTWLVNQLTTQLLTLQKRKDDN